ncbi:hypothetical protein PL8927_550183 [Planktothrix serta PCC 8927]|uniref:Uncharacterized protein n=1 Tax=Planktothrix serta PCC 8927 TaxID=671068 RepID=A0A7Z9BLR1_9CYAN|nr:hypothetical protein PL8927_550183 [Planktothrix serta PCC 8927]
MSFGIGMIFEIKLPSLSLYPILFVAYQRQHPALSVTGLCAERRLREVMPLTLVSSYPPKS